MKSSDLKKFNLPDKSGVYFFLGAPKQGGGGYNGRELLYIGKATSLRDRTKSYFSKDLIVTRGPLILDMVTRANKVEYQETDSVLEAIILEANLIKKYQPKYNTKEKDNKSFNYVVFTKDKISQVLVIRGRQLDKKKYKKVFGPFPNGMQLREAMRIIRKIFPYFDNHSNKKQNYQFYRQLALIPDKEKNNNIKNLILFFEGKKKQIIVNMKKEMFLYAKKKEFEKAGEIKKRIFALEHINDVALIKEEFAPQKQENFSRNLLLSGSDAMKNSPAFASLSFRIEAYDIAHMGGANMVGVMVVIIDGQVEKSEYKKFIIKTQKSSNDTGALEEVLSRRLRHTEWGLPNLIVVDGSTAQINVAKQVLSRYQFDIPIVSVVKDDKHKAKAIIGDEKIIKIYKKDILLANSESHRFAITYHKQKRNKNFLK